MKKNCKGCGRPVSKKHALGCSRPTYRPRKSGPRHPASHNTENRVGQ